MEQDPETGLIKQKTTDDEYLNAVRENEPATTKEIMDTIDVSRTGALYRLNKLEDEGVLKSKEAGTSLVWMVKE